MGNDSSIEIFSEADENEANNVNILGPKDESIYTFGKRMFKRSVEILTQPDRFNYTSSQLIPSLEHSDDFTVIEYNVKSPLDDKLLHGVLWKNKTTNNKRCVLYLHNNTRSVVDALEILVLCKQINADLLAFDLPGCGKSDGELASSLQIYIDKILSWWINYSNNNNNNNNNDDNNNNKDNSNNDNNDDISIIIWSRGMSTCHAIEYCHRIASSSSPPSSQTTSIVKFVVLDTPFVSLEQIVEDMKNTLIQKGYYFVDSMTRIGSRIYRNAIKNRLNIDPYEKRPVQFVSSITLPCHILSSSEDDYIKAEHAQTIHQEWGGPCTIKMNVTGNQFASRSANDVLSSIDMIRHYLRIRR